LPPSNPSISQNFRSSPRSFSHRTQSLASALNVSTTPYVLGRPDSLLLSQTLGAPWSSLALIVTGHHPLPVRSRVRSCCSRWGRPRTPGRPGTPPSGRRRGPPVADGVPSGALGRLRRGVDPALQRPAQRG